MSMTLDLANLSDTELKNLHGNANRLVKSGTAAQQAAAEELLPRISDEVSRRIATLEAERDKKRQAKRTAKSKRPAQAE